MGWPLTVAFPEKMMCVPEETTGTRLWRYPLLEEIGVGEIPYKGSVAGAIVHCRNRLGSTSELQGFSTGETVWYSNLVRTAY